jgi:carbon-monoxide dehydrogenase medium subunit
MKPPSYTYVAVDSVDDVLTELAEPGTVVLAGGQSLVALMNARQARPARLVDINRVRDLDVIEVDGDTLRIGALTRIRDVERNADIARVLPVLAEAAGRIAYPAVRNRATVGGNLAFADRDGTLPTVMLALDARIVVRGEQAREIAARDFFRGDHATALGPRELLTEVHVPLVDGAGSAFEEVCPRVRGWSLVNAAARVAVAGGGSVESVAVAVGGIADVPVRAQQVEAALTGRQPTADAVDEAVRAGADDFDGARSDDRAGAAYRQHLAAVVVRRALRRAIEQAWEA